MTLSYDLLDYENPADLRRVVVEWELSSVCNYHCSYCPTQLHDGRVRWPDFDVALRFCIRVIEHYRPLDVTFLFSGGEVTLYRRFVDLASRVRALGAAVAVLSNGSRTLSWWEEALPHLDEAILSYHVEFADSSAFIAVAELLSSRIPVQVNFVMVPERFDQCLAVAEHLQRRLPKVLVHQKPVMERWKRLTEYKSESLERLRIASGAGRAGEPVPPGTLLKGNLVKAGGEVREVVSPIQLIVNGENRWRSWHCSIGLETLLVRWDLVYRAACGVGGPIGSIYDDDISFPRSPICCTQQSCNCIGGIKATKRRLRGPLSDQAARPGAAEDV